MYGLLVGLACVVAIASFYYCYQLASYQNALGTLDSSYANILHVEAFQMAGSAVVRESDINASMVLGYIGAVASEDGFYTKEEAYALVFGVGGRTGVYSLIGAG